MELLFAFIIAHILFDCRKPMNKRHRKRTDFWVLWK